MRNTLASLFDGIGGFPLAWERLGGRAAWASEIEPVPIAITRRHFPDMKHHGDITTIDGAAVEPVDVVTFGSPCQDLSVAGKRAGLAGERSGLFTEATRIIRQMREATHGKQPTFAVWENVPGAFSSNGGEDFRAVLEELARVADPTVSIPRPKTGWESAGAVLGDGWSIAWRVLDAQFWGVPQRRRRIFAVLDLGGARAPEVLFERDGLPGHPAPGGEAGQGTAAPAQNSAGAAGFAVGFQSSQSGVRLCEKHATLDANNGPRRHSGVITAGFYGQHGSAARSVDFAIECAPCIGANGHPPEVVAAFKGGQGAKAGGIGYSETTAPSLTSAPSGSNLAPCLVEVWPTVNGTLLARHDSSTRPDQINNICCVATGQPNAEILRDLSPTLNCDHEQPYIADQTIVRRLTPLECERLQGYPDHWTRWGIVEKKGTEMLVENKDAPRYRATGNSLAIPCALYVLYGVMKAMSRKEQTQCEMD